jgi:hypothetical protein
METSGPLSLPIITPPRPRPRDRRGSGENSMVGLMERLARGESERRRFRERRATPRVAVELEVEEQQGDSRYVRMTHDLSTFGMSTRVGHTPPAGARLALSLFLPDEPLAPLKLDAEVLGPYDEKGGMRLRFRQPSLEAVRRIHKYLKQSA